MSTTQGGRKQNEKFYRVSFELESQVLYGSVIKRVLSSILNVPTVLPYRR